MVLRSYCLRFGGFGARLVTGKKLRRLQLVDLIAAVDLGFQAIPKPPKVGKIMAQHLEKAVILHTFGVQAISAKPKP